VAITFALFISFSQTLLGQGITTGTISGTVVDPAGAVVPNAAVTATSVERGNQLTAKSDGQGNFSFHYLPSGIYSVSISASGFAATTVSNIQVNAGVTTNLNQVKIALTSGNTQVEVNGSAAVLLQTTDSQVTTTFDRKTVANIPLNAGPDTIAEVIPGVVSVHQDNFANQNGDQYSVNGQSSRYNNNEIDGQSNNDNTIGGPQFFFGNQDAIQQIQVITNDFSAQYGRDAGAVINYITKSGSNTLHGTAFEQYQGQFLSSFENQQKNPIFGYCPPGQSSTTTNPCQTPVLPRYAENRWGGSIGGPAWKNKVFFFGSTFWDHVRVGAAPISSLPYLTPTPNGLKQLASALPGSPAVTALTNYGPYSVTQGNPSISPVFPSECPTGSQPTGTTCDETVLGPTGTPSTIEFAGVQRSIPDLFNDQEHIGRLDFQPTSKDHLFVRYMYQDEFETGVGGGEGGEIANGDFVNSTDAINSVGGDWTHTFTPHFVDQLRYSFLESKGFFQGGSYPNCLSTQILQCPSQVSFNGSNDDLGFGVNVNFPQGRTVKVTQIQNNATWTKGRHTLLFGGEFDYQNAPAFGLFEYTGNLVYQTMSDFIGDGNNPSDYMLLANGTAVSPFTEVDAAGYVQDDWKVTPNFTAHIGLRWEFYSQATNLLHKETIERQSNPATAFWDTSLPLSATTDPSVNNFYNGYQPRIGFAYNPSFDKKLVIRAGYAINESPIYYNLILLASSDAPVVNQGYFYCSPGVNCLPANGNLLAGSVRAANLSFLPTGSDPRAGYEQYFPKNLRVPYVQTYTLAIDHQIGRGAVGEIRYVGSKTTDDFQSVNSNPYMATIAAAFPNYISPSSLCQDPTANGYGHLNCDYNYRGLVTNGGWANYNGLELNLTTQNYHGLTSTISYTFSKNMDNTTDGFRSTGGGGSTIAFAQNPLNTSAGERGLSGNDFPNVVGIAFDYQLPKFGTSGLLSRVTNGFDIFGLYRFTSGQVYTPYQFLNLDSTSGGDSSFCDAGFSQASEFGVDTCRLVLSNKKAPAGSVAYLNPYVSVNGVATPGTPHFIVYNSDSIDMSGNYHDGTPVDPSTTRWIINNMAYAEMVGNPYPGSSRSLLRGPTFSELDASIMKTTQIAERINLQLSMSAYNALNQPYLGTGNAQVANSAFTQTQFNSSTPVANNSGFVSGNRFVILGAKAVF
jgi:outer membrane receptor protein involved in Fe transport